MGHEVEVKIAVADPAGVSTALERAGAVRTRPRELEDNTLYDRDGGALSADGRLLRLRRSGGRAVLTAKAPPDAVTARYKVRREEETEVSDAGAVARALEMVGFAVVWRYQKYRTTWTWRGCEVTLDEIPHGCFLELEGDPAAIDGAARELGYGPEDYLTATYADLHAEWCSANGAPAGDMVFEGVARAAPPSPPGRGR